MPPSGTSRVFRVLLQVDDIAQSQRFYEALLGTPGRDVRGGRVYFDSGAVILALLDASTEGTGRASPLSEPLYLSTSDLEGVYRRAERLGCLSSELIHNDPSNPAGRITVRPWGERSFYANDPSGNPLCFVDERTRFTGPSGPSKPRAARSQTRAKVRRPSRSDSTPAARRVKIRA
jgi:catechol 2,3-dioxygenase-like lactoylglutathione lyase family enzyme